MEELKYKVYAVTDENKCIISIESDLTLENTTGYIQIDEGTGDKYAHAQRNYFPKEKSLRDNLGRCNYKYIDNKIVELTDEEKEILFPKQEKEPTETEILQKQLLETQAIVANLQEQILLGGTK